MNEASQREASDMYHAGYWDERYSEVGDGAEQTHEWFRNFTELEPFLSRYLFSVHAPESTPRILHLGSGDSRIPYDLLERGYTNQLCIDFSSVLVQSMKTRHPVDGIEWTLGDVRGMPDVPSNSIDVAFDKGTLDNMVIGSILDPSDEVLQNAARYLEEVSRVLKDDGIFLCISHRPPQFIKRFLKRNDEWMIHKESMGDGGTFEYSGYFLKKLGPHSEVDNSEET